MNGQSSGKPTKLQLNGPGPFVSPAAEKLPFSISPAEGESLFRLGLTLEGGKQLLIPMDVSQLRKLWAMLDRLVGALGPERES